MAAREKKLVEKRKKLSQKASQPRDATSFVVRAITPNQPTQPQDPNYTGSSAASQDEEASKSLVAGFMIAAMCALGDEFSQLPWQESGKFVELVHSYHFFCRLSKLIFTGLGIICTSILIRREKAEILKNTGLLR